MFSFYFWILRLLKNSLLCVYVFFFSIYPLRYVVKLNSVSHRYGFAVGMTRRNYFHSMSEQYEFNLHDNAFTI